MAVNSNNNRNKNNDYRCYLITILSIETGHGNQLLNSSILVLSRNAFLALQQLLALSRNATCEGYYHTWFAICCTTVLDLVNISFKGATSLMTHLKILGLLFKCGGRYPLS